MKNLRVSLKLSLGFGIITLLLLMLGYIAISAINSAEKGADTLESIYVTELGIYNNLSRDVSDIGYNVVLYLSNSKDEQYSSINNVLGQVDSSVQQLKNLVAEAPSDPKRKHIAEFVDNFSPILSNYKNLVVGTYEARKKSLSTWEKSNTAATKAAAEIDTYLEAVMDGIGFAGDRGQQINVNILTDLDINTMALVSYLGEFRMNLLQAYQEKNSEKAKSLIMSLQSTFAESVALQKTIPYSNITTLANTMNSSVYAYIKIAEESVVAWQNESQVSGNRANVYRDLLNAVKVSSDELIKTADNFALDNITTLEANQQFFQIILITIVALTCVISLFLTKQITSPISACVNFAKEVANGNLSYKMSLNQKDEFGQLADALRVIPENLNGILNEYAELGQKISTGHLNTKGDPSHFAGEFKTLINGTNKIIDSYIAVIENVPSAVVMLDADQKVRYLNAAGRNACGDAFTDKTCKQIMNREDSGTASDALAKAIATLKPARGETIAHPQGASLYIKYFAVPMLDNAGKLLSIMQLILDVTEEKKLQETIMDVAKNATEISQRVASTATELSSQIGQAEQAAIVSLSQIESTSVAMTEMNSTVLEVARSAGNASTVAGDARAKADHGAKIVEDVVNSIADVDQQAKQLKQDMLQLGEDAESINAIMNVISDIADQTNLLALNAAIEAARAGEAGRGFAVVADEVRKLAEKTMHATVEVGNAINSVQASVETNMKNVDSSVSNIAEATEQARLAGSSLDEILALVENSSDQIQSIATAAEEQSSTSEEINQNLSTVTNSANTMSVNMSEATLAVNDLAEQASKLNELINQLQS